jgi:hypothetical protein
MTATPTRPLTMDLYALHNEKSMGMLRRKMQRFRRKPLTGE